MTDFSTLFALIKKSAMPDANLAEIEEALKSVYPPDDKDQALNWAKNIPSLRSAIDAVDSKGYERGFKKFDETDRPNVEKALRDSIYKELHPQETDDQKANRELKARLDAMEAKEKLSIQKQYLMEKSKEFGLDPVIAMDYAVYGDQAEETMKRHAEYIKSREDAIKTESAKAKFGGKTPPAGSGFAKSIKDMTPDEAMQYAMQGEAQKAEVLAALKK